MQVIITISSSRRRTSTLLRVRTRAGLSLLWLRCILFLQSLPNPQTLHKARPLLEYPFFPLYSGLFFRRLFRFPVCLMPCRKTEYEEVDESGRTSNKAASFSEAITTPSIIGNARRFLNSKPVCFYAKDQAQKIHLCEVVRTTASAKSNPNFRAILATPLTGGLFLSWGKCTVNLDLTWNVHASLWQH